MSSEMSNQEAIEMMNRCKQEILSLRAVIDRLQPKADAYDNVAAIIRLLPQHPVGMGEDLAWVLDKRIRELQPKPDAQPGHDS